ncbi:MAG: DbpA RNA binding domain-containing protein [Treponema sp.]|nr:DbpA RNA binding domain-containing protein [Treponema sp.]
MSIDKGKAKRNIVSVLEKLYGDTDLAALKEYQKIYKKEISLFRRSWAAAWLFMYYDQRETPSMQSAKTPAPRSFKNTNVSAEERTPVVEIPEEESKRLFISIGKNRRLFPREVITLIMSKASCEREDIGIIRILDNYSFVQVRDTRAEDIIAALNGFRFRGRTLAVNYAKPKSEIENQLPQ